MKAEDIKKILAKNKVISVYQLAILDFLNAAQKAEDIAGEEPSKGPIADDPTRRGRGYDIGLTVADRIIAKRRSLGGRFKNIYELAEIPFFGIDKFQDLVYTFMKLRSPVPSGLGKGFDTYIVQLSRLEIIAYRLGISFQELITLIRKLFFNRELITEAEFSKLINLNWDPLIPNSEGIRIPNAWASSSIFEEAMDFIQRKKVVNIGSDSINVQLLISGIEARVNPAIKISNHPKLQIEKNEEFLGFMMRPVSTAYQLLSQETQFGPEYQVDELGLEKIYEQEVTETEFNTIADIFSMDLNPEMSLTWNLLNYYTGTKKPSDSRFTNLATALDLGEYSNGLLSNDNVETRDGWVKKIIDGTFYLLVQNGKRNLVNQMTSDPKNDHAYLAYNTAIATILDYFIDRLTVYAGMEVQKPVVMSWNRLEARPRTDDFSRTLKAEVRDALWFISRQWQFGEFMAEDSGTALEMRVDMQTSKIQNYGLKDNTAQAYSDDVPMEALVEAEATKPDLTVRLEMGTYFLALLRKGLANYADSTVDKVINDFKSAEALHFKLPRSKKDYPEIYSNPSLVQHLMAVSNGRMIDGEVLYNLFSSGRNPDSFLKSISNSNIKNKVNEIGEQYLLYFYDLYIKPFGNSTSAWNAQQLEHQFYASVPANESGFSVLSTNEYADGHLDWYSFDFTTSAGGYDKTLTNDEVSIKNLKRKEISLLPTDLKYPGMPMARWWQFEDYKLNIGAVKANTNELPKLLMAEFALIYSNDWMLIPFDVGVGSLCDVKQVVVRDVFGQYTLVEAAGKGRDDDWKRWSLFNLNRIGVNSGPADNRLFVPPTVIRTMEGEPIEKVTMVRDEMSNMVWGIESKIPDDMGGGMDGGNAARRFYTLLESETTPTSSGNGQVENVAAIDYKLGTTVPENWIPFMPVRKGGANSRQIQLRRAAMPRIIDGRPPERIRPRTDLLRTGYDADSDRWNPYFLHEEEVPRSGVIVKRSWQRARWKNGKNFTWLGRRVTNGRGEANSGLQYDLIVNS